MTIFVFTLSKTVTRIMKNKPLTLPVFLLAACALTALVIAFRTSAEASDHVDGQITIDDPVADLSDLFAFPSPNTPGHLVIILNAYPFVSRSGHFSDRVTYSVEVRRAAMVGTGIQTAFETGEEAYRFDCSFETPHDRGAPHWATCTTPNGAPIRTQVDDEDGVTSDGVRVFAGRRADPFLFSSSWFATIVKEGVIPPANASNDISSLNVLSIALEVDVAQVFGDSTESLFAIASETTTQDSPNDPVRRIDRVGRPEISNARMAARGQEEDLRNRYNQANTFDLSPEDSVLFQQRLLNNVAYYDSLDGVRDWVSPWDSTLANLFLQDYLVVDAAMPFTVQSYFSIENSMLRNQPYTRPGGRVPGDNIINALFTTMVNGGHGREIATGIPTDGKPAQDQFPYLGEPATGIFSAIKTYFAVRAARKLAQ